MGLRHVFGEKPISKILDFLLVHRYWDYPLSAIAEATGVSYRTMQKTVPMLVKSGIMKETREVGKAKMYSLNFDSPSVKKLDEFSMASDIEFAEKHRKQKILAV